MKKQKNKFATDEGRWIQIIRPSAFICIYLWRIIPLLFIASTIHAAEADRNLALNPGLEEIGPDQLPAHWEKFFVGAGGDAVIDKSKKHAGQQSVRLTATEGTRLYLQSDPIPVVPGEKITATAWVKFKDVPPDKGPVILLASFTNSRDRSSQDKGADLLKFAVAERPKSTDGDWRRISGTVTVPPMMCNLRLRAGFTYSLGTCWWDDFTVTAQQPVVARIELPDDRLSPGSGTVPIGILNRNGSRGRVHIAVEVGKVIKATTQPLVANAVDVQLTGQPTQEVNVPLQISERGPKMFLTAGASAPGNNNKLFSEDRRPVEVPAAVELDPIVPTHWCVEDGAPTISCQLEMAVKQATLQNAAVSFNVLDSGNKSVFTFSPPKDKPLTDGTNTFDLKLPALPQGQYTIAVQIKPTSGEAMHGDQPFIIIPRHLAKVTINADGYPVYDGKAIFPLGIFNGGGHTEEMGQAGFTVNHAYNAANAEIGIPAPDAYAKEFMDKSEKAGLKVCLLIPRGLAAGGDWDGVRRRIRLFKNHPALLCWDEEEMLARGDMKPEGLVKLRQIIREEDPNHPFMVGDTRDLISRMPLDRSRIFPLDQMDMGMWWWYPIPLQSRDASALNGEEATLGTELPPPGFLLKSGTDKPIWMGIQSYKKPKSRFPTPIEYRTQAYLTVIWGAKGIMWYGGGVTGGMYGNLEEGHWDDFKKLAGELHEMFPVFMGKTLDAPTLEPAASPVSAAIKQDGNHLVLLVANRGIEPVQMTIRSPQIRPGQIAVFKENRQVQAQAGFISDHFESLETHVYELAK